MSQRLKYISRIKDEFDIAICGMNGVFVKGSYICPNQIDTLVKIYQSGKKVMIATNSGWRVHQIFCWLKQNGVPMNIFSAIISAGEIAHFYLKNNQTLGKRYYPLSQCNIMQGLDFEKTADIKTADFVLAETDMQGLNVDQCMAFLGEALRRKLPLVCVGNNTSILTENGISGSVGMLAEQYAMQGGKIIPFGKPDARIGAYLCENIADFKCSRCLIIGDCMATDMRLGNSIKAQTLLLTNGVHQLPQPTSAQIDDLSRNYGLNIDYYMEELRW